jgi:hypothetical protein
MFDYVFYNEQDHIFGSWKTMIYYDCRFRSCICTNRRTTVHVIDCGGSVVESIEYIGNIYKKRGLDIETITERLKKLEKEATILDYNKIWNIIFAPIPKEEE